ncbi:MAG TPA: hypothetical protein PKL04_10725 [Methanofastidiosum sp.]|jgi:hypothetical protein|nr:hypothetical protein [Methanofastidiosum sp.]
MKQVLSLNYALIIAKADAFELNHPSTIFTDDDIEVITATSAEEAETKLIKATTVSTAIPDLPKVGEPVYKDRLYFFEGKIYKCIQDHIRTIYSPAETLALFNIYRKEEINLQWIAGEKVIKNCVRLYDSKSYKCLQDHVTQSDWTPDKTLGVLWQEVVSTSEIPVWKQPTGAHDAYKKGDKVHFPTINDPVYESLIDANVWAPLSIGAEHLWKKL